MQHIISSCANKTARDGVEAIQEKAHDRRQVLATAIRDVASNCSYWAHAAIRISSTAEFRLNTETSNPNYASFADAMLDDMPEQVTIRYLELVRDRIEYRRDISISSMDELDSDCNAILSEHLKQTILSNEGNCWEKAMLAAVFFNATYKSTLQQQGFTEDEILDAQIQVRIGGNDHIEGGDHGVCIVTHSIDEGCLIVDPWMNASVCDGQNLEEICNDNIGQNAGLMFEFKPRILESVAVKNKDCIKAVMEFAGEVLGAEPQFADLFKFYESRSR